MGCRPLSWLAVPTSWSRLHAEPLEDKQLLPTKATGIGKPCCAHPALEWPCSGGSAGQFTSSLQHEVGDDGVITLHLPSEGIMSSPNGRQWWCRKVASKAWKTCLDISSRKYRCYRSVSEKRSVLHGTNWSRRSSEVSSSNQIPGNIS